MVGCDLLVHKPSFLEVGINDEPMVLRGEPVLFERHGSHDLCDVVVFILIHDL